MGSTIPEHHNRGIYYIIHIEEEDGCDCEVARSVMLRKCIEVYWHGRCVGDWVAVVIDYNSNVEDDDYNGNTDAVS